MKKIVLLALTAIIMVGCYEAKAYYEKQIDLVSDYEPTTIEYSGCEYVVVQSYWKKHLTITHKGNCRFCAERRRHELQSIVEQFKTK